MKNHFITFVFPLILFFGVALMLIVPSLSFSPQTEIIKIDDSHLQISTNENVTIEGAKYFDNETFRLYTKTNYIECVYDISPDKVQLYSPEYRIYPAELDGSICKCPTEIGYFENVSWKYKQFGFIYQPEKNKNVTKIYGSNWLQCHLSNCYNSGMFPPNNVSFLSNNSGQQNFNIQITIDEQTQTIDQNTKELTFDNIEIKLTSDYICKKPEIVIYEGKIKNATLYQTLYFNINKSINNFEYRVINRDSIISEIETFKNINVDYCYMKDNRVHCLASMITKFDVKIVG